MIRYTPFSQVLLSGIFSLLAFVSRGQEIREMEASEFTYCELIEVNFSNKIGIESDIKELYLRCSVQDYFIKLCESQVTRTELEPFINKGIKVKMKILDGNWDSCPGDFQEMQSRTGRYAVIETLVLSAEIPDVPQDEEHE
ncbi:MAG: hypothetical protein A3D92_06175 [Bacteroidetes bacterium RIFCSPHIGHO2_02_FULL_44_7]|nr:MAG: hypothetical protein A3D92_06175 [Bacteroidetes bacterium RIFCSPHIGHO2_02_FULL_44_7]